MLSTELSLSVHHGVAQAIDNRTSGTLIGRTHGAQHSETSCDNGPSCRIQRVCGGPIGAESRPHPGTEWRSGSGGNGRGLAHPVGFEPVGFTEPTAAGWTSRVGSGTRVMGADTGQRVRVWSLREAPAEFRKLFAGGRDSDWLAHVPSLLRNLAESSLLRWRRIYPVESVELPDGGVLYLGAESEAMAALEKSGETVIGSPPGGSERRRARRTQIGCPLWYETQSPPKQTGSGRTIDMSSGGISFSSESSLRVNTQITVVLSWPVPLEGGVPVNLRVTGRVVRQEGTKAALQIKTLSFSTAR